MSEELAKTGTSAVREGEFRDIHIITTEIRTLYQQAVRMELTYAVQLGRKLTEAKALVEHGEWGNWIRENLPFSQDKASMMMKIYDAYGANQESLFGDINSDTYRNLGIYQAFTLLSVPENEREEFVRENDVESMSVRELKKAIEERDAAAKAKAELEEENRKLKESNHSLSLKAESNEELRNAAEEAAEKQKKAEAAKDEAQKKLQEARSALAEAKANPSIPAEMITKLQEEAKETAEKAAEAQLSMETARREEAEKEMKELRKKLAVASPEAATFKTYFEMFQEDFNRMHALLLNIGTADRETASKFSSALKTLLKQFDGKLT